MIKYWNQRRYTAWFNPEYRIEDADYSHADYDERLEHLVEGLRRDIEQNGMQNPLLVTRKGDKWIIHPGKCRAKALVQLGETHAPAVVVDYNRVGDASSIPEGCEFLDSVERVQELFTGDCVVEMSHRWLTVKKLR